MRRSLPSPADTARILAERRTRPPRRPPPPAGKSLAPLLKSLEERFGPGAGPLASRWREIVGETIAKRTEPVKLIKGRGGVGAVLELKVDGPAAALVQHQAPDILERVNMFLGKGAVAKLRIVQGPVKAAAVPAATRNRRKANAPLDAAQEAALAQAMADAPDGPLKASLLKLGRAVMRHSAAPRQGSD